MVLGRKSLPNLESFPAIDITFKDIVKRSGGIAQLAEGLFDKPEVAAAFSHKLVNLGRSKSQMPIVGEIFNKLGRFRWSMEREGNNALGKSGEIV